MKFDYLSFKVWSSRSETPGFSLDSNEWLPDFEPNDRYDVGISIDIFGENFDFEKDKETKKKIGIIYGAIFDVESASEDHESVYDIFDSHSQEALNLYEALKDSGEFLKYEYVGLGGNVLYIDFFYIEEKYRCKGIGTKVLEMLEDVILYAVNYKLGCIATVPVALDKSKRDGYLFDVIEDREWRNRVKKFFINAGYRTIPDCEFMYINTDYKRKKLKMV